MQLFPKSFELLVKIAINYHKLQLFMQPLDGKMATGIYIKLAKPILLNFNLN